MAYHIEAHNYVNSRGQTGVLETLSCYPTKAQAKRAAVAESRSSAHWAAKRPGKVALDWEVVACPHGGTCRENPFS